jgi:hypothetical protein
MLNSDLETELSKKELPERKTDGLMGEYLGPTYLTAAVKMAKQTNG